MLGTTSLQEDIAGVDDRVEIGTILDTLSLKNIQEERSTRQLGGQDRRPGESGAGMHTWRSLALGGICSCGNLRKNVRMIGVKVLCIILVLFL